MGNIEVRIFSEELVFLPLLLSIIPFNIPKINAMVMEAERSKAVLPEALYSSSTNDFPLIFSPILNSKRETNIELLLLRIILTG
ncbi:hypothetical protein SDC9_163574 [bioreactor metagenome]|uniref:Uncharacterized protein n=1 Tax=bioreactor metagenome TaxID=1076179 RepID=A0A645FR91_9ZZZZ